MNLLQLVLKQMRQRALSTWLTLLSVLLGVTLAIAIIVVRRESASLFGQSDFGYDILIGPPKGSPLQLTLNTVYHMDQSPGVIPYELYEDMARKTAPPPGKPDYRRYVKLAVPFMVGDSYKGRHIVGTAPVMFGVDDEGKPVTTEPFRYRKDKQYELAQGRVFHPRKFEAVIGAEIAEKEHLTVYDEKLSEAENEKRNAVFQATHGFPSPNQKPDIHKPKWHVVGILKPTHTANDRVLFVPYISLFAIAEHEDGMLEQALQRANINPGALSPEKLDQALASLGFDPKRIPESVKKKYKIKSPTDNKLPPKKPAPPPGGDLLQDNPPAEKPDDDQDEDAYHLDEKGEIVPDLPKEQWEISAIIVKSRGEGGFSASQLMYNFKVIDDRATAVSPASVMKEFFDTFLANSALILLVIATLVSVVAAASIMTTIYNSVSARKREIAILRALGATRTKILSLICLEATLIGLFGAILGLVFAHLTCGVGSIYMERTIGQAFNWLAVDTWEILYLIAVLLLAFLAGLVPALMAYRTPVANNLAAG